MTELNAKELKEQLEQELLAESIAKQPLVVRAEGDLYGYDEDPNDRLIEVLGEAHYASNLETENFKQIGAKLVWDGSSSEDFAQQLIFLYKPSGKYLVLEADHNSYEYMEYDYAFIGKLVEKTIQVWAEE